MKKLFTLLTLLLTSVGAATSAWAETYDNEVLTVTWADPSTITAGTANPTASVLSCPWAGTSSGTDSYDNIKYTQADSEKTFSFTVTPFPGLTFTPENVEFDMVKFGSDNCFATVDIVYGDAETTSKQLADLKEKTDICRNKENVNADKRHQTYTLDATKAGTGAVTLKITLKPASGKKMGVANIVITGKVSGTTQTVTSYTITTESSDEAVGSVSGGGSYVENSKATLTATAKEGGAFVKWQKDGADFEGNATASIEVTATADVTYTAVFKKLFTVTYDLDGYGLTTTKVLNNYKAGSFNEKYADADDKYTIPSYSHYFMYREGFIFSKWEDQDGIQYEKGTEINITKDVILKPVWTATTETLANSKADGTVTWNLRYSTVLFNAWQGTGQVGYFTKPFTVNEQSIAVPMIIDATGGKIDNSGRTDKDNAQVNQGTKFTIPAVKGMTVVIADANTAFSTTTVAGTTEYEKSNSDKTLTYTYTGDEETIDIVINESNQYLKTIAVTYPAAFAEISTKGANAYASYVTSNKLDFASAEGITAYIATGLNGAKDAVVLQSVDVVPAGTAIIVKTETQGATVNVPVTTAEASDVTANLLVAGDGTTVANSDYYYLASDQFHLATSGTLQSGKAYLQIPATARNLSIIIGGDATGISAIAKSQEPNANGYYNLAGLRVAQPTKGLYIQDGKKVIIK